METEPYKLTISQEANVCIIQFSGEIDYCAVEELTPMMQKLLSHCETDIHLDLGNVTFIDSEGLKLLMNMAMRVHNNNHRLHIIRCSYKARRVMELVGVYELLSNC